MSISSSARAWTAAGALSLFSLAASLDFHQRVKAANAASGDPYQVNAQQQRLSALAASLPPGAIVGYLSDESLDSPRGSAMFYGTLYALAPTLVLDHAGDRRFPLVVGNFARPADYTDWGRKHSLRVKQDFGQGVVLFERDR